MENLIKTSQRLVNSVQMDTFRYLYHEINWDDRLVMIKGARGVGKTTMLRQRIKEKFGPNGTALYASCDNLWFTENRIVDLAAWHYDHGGTHLYLDEIHRYRGNWQVELLMRESALRSRHKILHGQSCWLLRGAETDEKHREIASLMASLARHLHGNIQDEVPPHLARRLAGKRPGRNPAELRARSLK